MDSNETSIAIMGDQVPASHERLEISRLRFFVDNPRVYAAIREMREFDSLTADEKQVSIYERLLEEPSVRNLIPQVRTDRGLQEPVIVRHDTMEVIEGNSRLAVYRKLYAESHDDELWEHIPCLVVSTLTEDQQTRLLGQIHLHGRTEWSRYARALFCFRSIVEEKKEIETLAKLSGLRPSEIKKDVNTIELMKDNGDNEHSRFSYYETLVRNKKISEAIEEDESLRKTVLAQTKEAKFTAQQLRDKLPTVIEKKRILRKFADGELLLEDAFERARLSGAEQKLRKARANLDDVELEDLKNLSRSELRSIQQILKQVRRKVDRISKMLDQELS